MFLGVKYVFLVISLLWKIYGYTVRWMKINLRGCYVVPFQKTSSRIRELIPKSVKIVGLYLIIYIVILDWKLKKQWHVKPVIKIRHQIYYKTTLLFCYFSNCAATYYINHWFLHTHGIFCTNLGTKKSHNWNIRHS